MIFFTVWFFGGDIAVDNFVDFVRFTEIKITRFKYFYENFVSKHVVFGAFLKYMYIFLSGSTINQGQLFFTYSVSDTKLIFIY